MVGSISGEQSIAAAVVIWTAGTKATPVAEWLGVRPGHDGRVPVGPDLCVAAHPAVTVIGDAALALGRDGKPLPALAPVAKQQGGFVARADLAQAPPTRARRLCLSRLRHLGHDRPQQGGGRVRRVRITGFIAWITWAVAHIFFLIGFRNRVMVSAQWPFAYLTHDRAAA